MGHTARLSCRPRLGALPLNAAVPLAQPRKRGRPRNQAPVLDSALALVRSQGVRAVTMEAIAEKAGITKVTLYRHWPSKAALLADALLTELAAALPLDAEKPAWEAISSHAVRLGQALEGDIGGLFRSVAAECVVEEAALRDFRDRYLGLRRRAALQIIRAGLKDGSFTADGRAEDLHDAIYGGIFYRFLFGFGALDRKRVLQLLTTILKPAA